MLPTLTGMTDLSHCTLFSLCARVRVSSPDILAQISAQRFVTKVRARVSY